MRIIGHTVEQLEDPFNLLSGERFEFFLNLEVDEEDELYSEEGIQLRAIFVKNEDEFKILQYHFIEKTTEKVLDFGLEDEEEVLVKTYCIENLPKE